MPSIILIIIVALISTSCGKQNTWAKFEKYADAGEAAAFESNDGIAYERVYFLNKKYPYNGVVKHYESVIERPWIPCQPQDGWTGYLDSSGKETAYVHRIMRHWANHDSSRLLMLAISYRSLGTKVLKEPNNDNQTILLVEYIQPNLKSSLKELELICEIQPK